MGSHVKAKLQDTFAYPPRAMRLERAAAYLDISRASFQRLVDEGVLPKPIKIRSGIVCWDRFALDAFVDRIDDERSSIEGFFTSE
jgi:predicted DNA-binding transcriptional regulator AlpA